MIWYGWVCQVNKWGTWQSQELFKNIDRHTKRNGHSGLGPRLGINNFVQFSKIKWYHQTGYASFLHKIILTCTNKGSPIRCCNIKTLGPSTQAGSLPSLTLNVWLIHVIDIIQPFPFSLIWILFLLHIREIR